MNYCKEECYLLKQKEAEVAELKKEQELLFLLLELGLIAMEHWAREKGLLSSSGTQSDQGLSKGNDQISMLLNKVGKSSQEVSLERLIGVLKSL